MTRDFGRAARLKDEGNRCFTSGDFVGAESLYSKALVTIPNDNHRPVCMRAGLALCIIIADDAEPTLYTNRAMARIKLQQYDSAIWDCQICIKLGGANMKAHFIQSQCLLALQDYDGALENALKAHRLGAEANDKSLTSLTNQVLRCKKERWEDKEKKRSREAQEIEGEVSALMERERDALYSACDDELERSQIKEEWDQKMESLRVIFEKARAESEKKREVPEWAIDDISFGIMVDPVVTKCGKSYERASIMEALRRRPVDPHTREPLQPNELRPNLALRQACEEFLENNGWAVDW
ncbi:U-box-domain-containing protein [Poronia punctata]|nr:U-box-domain-containing protein [Poronia punctata]